MSVQNSMFEQAAELLDIQGENHFCVRASRHVRTIKGLPQSVRSLLQRTEFWEQSGIGKDLAGKIADIVRASRLELIEFLEEEASQPARRNRGPSGAGPQARQAILRRISRLCDIARELPVIRERFEIAYWIAALIGIIGLSRRTLGAHCVTHAVGGFLVGRF
jgi:DNA polymerase/3'-5' exonuclease PolX